MNTEQDIRDTLQHTPSSNDLIAVSQTVTESSINNHTVE